MIELRYSAPYSLDVSGTVPELQNVRRAVLDVAKSGVRVELNADCSIDPQPYETALSKLIVSASAHPTNVMVSSDAVYIEGAPNCLEALASFLDFNVGAKKGDHAHYEHYEGNDWIAPDAVPVVFSVR
jgi:hypothetical protein